MTRAIELAQFGAGFAAPNPMVGCVIVANGRLIGEGFHARYGQHHAEVSAIRSVQEKHLLPESTMYVSLEPCNHSGKTPPCTHLIVENGIRNVVIATEDPNPLVSGAGIRFLKEAGAEVGTGLLSDKASFLNRRFFTYHQQQRPYVILRWAESADGYIDPPRTNQTRQSISVSGQISRQKSHLWRSEEQAILVGAQTVVQDNPSLLPRLWPGRFPLRVVFDPHLRIPAQSQLFTDGFSTIVFNHIRQEKMNGVEFIKINPEEEMIPFMLNELAGRNIISLMVEGGAETIRRFLMADVWDEIRRFRSPGLLGGGIAAPVISINADETESSGADLLEIFYRKRSKLI
jgi:diaminohydroxyphosphoribosylaminopyrimidine deaminase / 5-amino-6-(5-phosphoribosylamino)uracil reductase